MTFLDVFTYLLSRFWWCNDTIKALVALWHCSNKNASLPSSPFVHLPTPHCWDSLWPIGCVVRAVDAEHLESLKEAALTLDDTVPWPLNHSASHRVQNTHTHTLPVPSPSLHPCCPATCSPAWAVSGPDNSHTLTAHTRFTHVHINYMHASNMHKEDIEEHDTSVSQIL